MSNSLVTLVIGLGEIGNPIFNLISKKNGLVRSVDILPVEIKDSVGVMHICYPFQVPNGFVQTTSAYAMKYKPQVIVINSTVTPGTTEGIEKASGIPVVYSPVRGKHTRMEAELLHYQKFIAGTNENAVNIVKSHFIAIGMKTKVISSPRTLELAKLLETTYFGLMIAWAQEMNRFAVQVDGNYFELAQFFEEISYLPPVVFQPGFIGGHCVMPNIELLKMKFDSKFLDAIKNSNRHRAKELSSEEELKLRIEPLNLKPVT